MHTTLWIALIGATVAFICVVVRVSMTRGPVTPGDMGFSVALASLLEKLGITMFWVGLLAYFLTNK